jgi:hypothetical protein
VFFYAKKDNFGHFLIKLFNVQKQKRTIRKNDHFLIWGHHAQGVPSTTLAMHKIEHTLVIKKTIGIYSKTAQLVNRIRTKRK